MMAPSAPVCLLTGGTAGIGLAAAVELARQGITLIIIGRDEKKGANAVERIRSETGHDAMHYIQTDLAEQAQVRQLAAAVLEGYPRLDILVHNAGLVQRHHRESADGLEMTWAVNHLAPFLLTYLVLDRMIIGASARIIVVSSDSHARGRIHWDDPGLTKGYNPFRAYAQSKLANLLFTYELARRLQGSGVTANAIHPGFVHTDIGRSMGGIAGWGWDLAAMLFGRSPEDGAKPLVRVATSAEAADWNGHYVTSDGPEHSSSASYRAEDAARLWRLSARQVGVPEDWPNFSSRR